MSILDFRFAILDCKGIPMVSIQNPKSKIQNPKSVPTYSLYAPGGSGSGDSIF